MEPRYNEEPRDRGNVFVITAVRYKRNPVFHHSVYSLVAGVERGGMGGVRVQLEKYPRILHVNPSNKVYSGIY